jgi:hypothetical protein
LRACALPTTNPSLAPLSRSHPPINSQPLQSKPSKTTARRPAAAARPLRRTATTVAPRALLNLFGGAKKAAPAAPKREPRPTIVPQPSFNIPATLAALSALSVATHHNNTAGVFGVLAAFLAIQATRVRFVFDDEALEVVISGKQPGEEGSETENAFVGGRNRWSYDSFVNWEVYFAKPLWFPVLVYFKETQTKPEGQIHFFPVIFDAKTLYDVMKERCGPSVGSGGDK